MRTKFKTIKELEKELEQANGIDNLDVEDGQLEQTKQICEMIEELNEEEVFKNYEGERTEFVKLGFVMVKQKILSKIHGADGRRSK